MDMMGVMYGSFIPMTRREDDNASVPLIEDRKIPDREFKKTADAAMKRLLHMRKYRMRYQSMLVCQRRGIECST